MKFFQTVLWFSFFSFLGSFLPFYGAELPGEVPAPPSHSRQILSQLRPQQEDLLLPSTAQLGIPSNRLVKRFQFETFLETFLRGQDMPLAPLSRPLRSR